MTKIFFKRGIIGIPIGITINFVIAIIVSIILADGDYHPVVPNLADTFGNEINAVIVQAFLCGTMGFVYSGTSVVWDKENWSLAKQTGIVFAVYAITMFPIAYISKWMQPNFLGIISYFAIFAVIFIMIWIGTYFYLRHKILQLNANLKDNE